MILLKCRTGSFHSYTGLLYPLSPTRLFCTDKSSEFIGTGGARFGACALP